MKKAQNTVEFIIVIMFFVIVTVLLLTSYLRIFPSESTKAREQTACSQAETLAIQLLEMQGNETNWHSSGELYELGFAESNEMEIDHDKFAIAKSRGYYNISTDANISISFKLSYNAYALNFTNYSTPVTLPNSLNPRVFIFGNRTELLVYAGSNSTRGDFSMTLFFPFITLTEKACDSGALEAGDTNTTTSKDYGDEIKLSWSIGTNDLDCVNLTMNNIPNLIFIKDMSFENKANGQTFPIYLWNETKLKNEFGSSGSIDKEKSFCEVERVGIIIDGSERIPSQFKVLSWR